MRKILCGLVLLLACLSAHAQYIVGTLTVTNTPNDGDTLVVNGITRTAKTVVATPSSQFLIDANTNVITTNLYQQIAANPFVGVITLYGSSNVLSFRSTAQAVTIGGTWASYSSVTQSTTNTYVVRVPIEVESATQRTNIASKLVAAIDTYPSNTFGVTSPALSNFVGIASGKTITGTNFFTGPNIQSNANQQYMGGIVSNVVITNFSTLGGSNGSIALMTVDRSALTSFFQLTGTNGLIWNMKLSSPVMTNAQNYGQPFRSPGSGTGSEQFGVGAVASANLAIAFGDGAFANSPAAVALGNVAYATSNSAVAFGTAAQAGGWGAVASGGLTWAMGTNAVAIGYQASAGDLGGSLTNNSPTAIGAAAVSQFDYATALGAGATTTQPHQLMLGTSAEYVQAPGSLLVAGGANITGGLTNLIQVGTGTVNGSLAFIRKNNTSLAAGANADIDISTNLYVKVSGPILAFSIVGIAGGTDGRMVIIQNSTGNALTIANDSGLDAVAANRIYTGTGADVAQANNPGVVTLIYDAAVSRWVLVSKN